MAGRMAPSAAVDLTGMSEDEQLALALAMSAEETRAARGASGSSGPLRSGLAHLSGAPLHAAAPPSAAAGASGGSRPRSDSFSSRLKSLGSTLSTAIKGSGGGGGASPQPAWLPRQPSPYDGYPSAGVGSPGGGGGGPRGRPGGGSADSDADTSAALDEQLARQLQQQYDSEAAQQPWYDGGGAVAAAAPRNGGATGPAPSHAPYGATWGRGSSGAEHSERLPRGSSVVAGSAGGGARAAVDGGGCGGCGGPFGWFDGGQRVMAMGKSWHPGCFVCGLCSRPFSGGGVFTIGTDQRPYHAACHQRKFVPVCTVCDKHIAMQADGRITWNEHPFWRERYCPSHNGDGTPRCGGCQRLQRAREPWPALADGRRLCGMCSSSVLLDTRQAQPLYNEVVAFYAAMGLPLPAAPPLLLVDGSALNAQGAAQGRERNFSDGPVFHTRGLCLSEERTTYSVPAAAAGVLGRLGGGGGGAVRVASSHTSVTAILVLQGLPRLLTGSIMAHELCHAFFRLAGYGRLPPEVEEGTCQLMAYLWLEHQRPQPGSNDERLASFFAHEVRNDLSPVYGDGFRAAYDAFSRAGLYPLLQHIRAHKAFPQ